MVTARSDHADHADHADDAVVIVGAGVVGAAVAYHLADLGHSRVCVYDARLRDGLPGSAGLAPGFVGQLSATPELSVLAVDSVATYLELAKDAPEPIFRQVGCLEVATSPTRLEQSHRDVAYGLQLGIEATVLDPEATVALAPDLVAPENVLGGLHIPSDGAAEPVALVEALVAAAEARGARFHWGTPVRALETDGSGGRVTGIRTETGTVPAGQVVLAAGIWGPALAAEAGLRLPMIAVQHPYVFTAERPELDDVPDTAPIVRYPDETVYTRRHGRRYGLGSYAHDPLPTAPGQTLASAELPFHERDFGAAVEAATALVPAFRGARLERRLNGVFALTPDELPFVGPAPGLPGLWIAEASWITHAAGVARQLAHQLLGLDNLTVDPARLSPDRFRDWSDTRAREAALHHYRGIYDAH